MDVLLVFLVFADAYTRAAWRKCSQLTAPGHLRTTNIVEGRWQLCGCGRTPRSDSIGVDRGTVVIWKMLMVAETEFRRLNRPGAAG